MDEAGAAMVIYAKDIARVAGFYSGVLDVTVAATEDDHIVLEAPSFQIVVVRVPAHRAQAIHLDDPPRRREETPIKPVFYVADFAIVRERAPALGGSLNAATREWRFGVDDVCDGVDPEGNVVQFRRRAR